MYAVKYHRIEGSIFHGLKYAEIRFADTPPEYHGEPIKVLYGFTWNHVARRVSKWMKQHEYDRTICWGCQ